MQDFDTVIRKLIETGAVSLDDGLSFATNQNNLLLQLKGLGGTEDFINAQPAPSGMPLPPQPAKPSNSVLDMIEK